MTGAAAAAADDAVVCRVAAGLGVVVVGLGLVPDDGGRFNVADMKSVVVVVVDEDDLFVELLVVVVRLGCTTTLGVVGVVNATVFSTMDPKQSSRKSVRHVVVTSNEEGLKNPSFLLA